MLEVIFFFAFWLLKFRNSKETHMHYELEAIFAAKVSHKTKKTYRQFLTEKPRVFMDLTLF